MKRLFYLPCEAYGSRWTEFVSKPDGMFERQCRDLGIQVLPIRLDSELRTVKSGVVLNTVERCKWAFFQTQVIVERLFEKGMTDDDVIYIEDFFHPGMEMLPYAMDLAGIHPKIYSFCHAQSVDPNDFTARMKPWMRGFEKAWANCQAGIFVAAPELRDMLLHADVGSVNNVFVSGTVFDSRVLLEVCPVLKNVSREKAVVFSSRWDTEKNPGTFCNLAQRVLAERNDVSFLVLSGLPRITSNNQNLLTQLQAMVDLYPSQFKVITNLSKKKYYETLQLSSVQFNCASQDFVSYTLLEAAVYGMHPLYPNYLTFPAALNFSNKNLYRNFDVQDAKEKLYALLEDENRDYSFVYGKYELSVKRMAQQMGLI